MFAFLLDYNSDLRKILLEALQKLKPLQVLVRLFGFGKKIEKMSEGDVSVWPFFNVAQYDRALEEGSDGRDCV